MDRFRVARICVYALQFARSKAHHAAMEIDHLILQSDDIRSCLVRLKPEFAMILMDRSYEFRTQFFRDAINDRASHFYSIRPIEAH